MAQLNLGVSTYTTGIPTVNKLGVGKENARKMNFYDNPACVNSFVIVQVSIMILLFIGDIILHIEVQAVNTL